jgi:autotransporter-associated beta strand protein
VSVVDAVGCVAGRWRVGTRAAPGRVAFWVFGAVLAGGLCVVPVQAQAQSVDIPLNLVYEPGGGVDLTINVGIGGASPRPYIFDTGSNVFVAQYTAGAFGTVPSSQMGLPTGQHISYGDGTGFTYNVVGTPSLTFYQTPTSTTGVTLNAVTPSNAASTFLLGAITAANVSFPEGANPGFFSGDYGIFGAGNFTGGLVGGVLGQAVVPGTTDGYVVAADGQPLSSINAGSTYAPYLTSPNGPQVSQDVTSCSPCAILGLTPAVEAQFKAVNEMTVAASGTFPNSGAPAANEEPYNLPVSLSAPGQTTVNFTQPTLLDTGTNSYFLGISSSTLSHFTNGDGTLTVSGTTSGATPSSVTIASSGSCCGPYTASSTSGMNIIGLGFFLTNSVMYNLSGQVVGYTSNFVTDQNIDTSSSPLVVDSTSPPLGLAGVISGTGRVEINSGGSATLSGTNTYSGATTVDGGFLALVGTGSISYSSDVSVSGTGMFDISGLGSGTPVGGYITSLSSTDNTGVVQLGANQLVLTAASGTFSGIIQDGGGYGGTGGSLAVTGGVETLSGANTYTGGTVLTAGEIIVGASSIGLPGSIISGPLGTGTLAMSAGTTLSFASTGNFTIANNISISGDPIFTPPDGTTQTLTGVISDGGTPGIVEMQGPGTLVLSGANTYSGGTTISGGTLQVTQSSVLNGGGTAIVSSSVGTGMVTFNAGTFQAGANNLTFNNTFFVDTGNTGTIDTQSNTLTLSGISGVSASLIGSGTIDKIGTGTLALDNVQMNNGTISVQAGTVQAANANALGQATNYDVGTNGTLDINGQAQTVQTLTGTGTVTNGGTNSPATLTVGTNNVGNTTPFIFDGVIQDGAGTSTTALTVDGSRPMILTGTNTYTGGTLVCNCGTLQLGNGGGTGSIVGDVTLGGTLIFNRNNTYEFDGTISDGGGGKVVQKGTGTTYLTQANSYTGGTTISAGILEVALGTSGPTSSVGSGRVTLDGGTFQADGWAT